MCHFTDIELIVRYDTSAIKRFLTSVSLQHEPKASHVITLVKKTFFRTTVVRNFISRGVKMRISAFTHSSDIKIIIIIIIITIIRFKYIWKILAIFAWPVLLEWRWKYENQ